MGKLMRLKSTQRNEDEYQVCAYIDASHAVHPVDCHSQLLRSFGRPTNHSELLNGILT
jgi:hypothetical protein